MRSLLGFALLLASLGHSGFAADRPPIGPVGRSLHYRNVRDTNLPASTPREWILSLGPVDADPRFQWIELKVTKAGGGELKAWWLANGYPSPLPRSPRPQVRRYVVQESSGKTVEYRDRHGGGAVLPSLVDSRELLPRAQGPAPEGFAADPPADKALYLGHTYLRVPGEVPSTTPTFPPPLPDRVTTLSPGLLIGLPSNRRTRDDIRRYDGSEYEYVRLSAEDYQRMVDAGVSCLRIDKDQLPFVEPLNAFYWGVSPAEFPYPDFLYRSCYLGPELFLDEPAVTTRDSLIRPRFAKEPEFRRQITPQAAFDYFRTHFDKVLAQGAPVHWRESLASRKDVDLGDLRLSQANLYSWETMIATAGYQLSRDPVAPAAIVFEPPGRIGSRRTLPEFNMSYGCQLPVENPGNLAGVLFGFLRGAARATGKQWGTSIYGAFDRADAPWFFTHAYDLGATHFFFWDNYQLACVPFGECLALARHLQNHADNHPPRDLARLRNAAEVAILLPPGYNLGHVQMGKGSLWGVGELNLERTNSFGVKYRTVMANAFVEIERCLRLGTEFDLLWDLPGLTRAGYREVIVLHEDGTMTVLQGDRREKFATARVPARPDGEPPRLDVALPAESGTAPFELTARATVSETTAPVFYTTGADPAGILHNALVGWDLFGPGEEDYRPLYPSSHQPQVESLGNNTSTVTIQTRLGRPGHYRLRAAVSDLAGRTTVRWLSVDVKGE